MPGTRQAPKSRSPETLALVAAQDRLVKAGMTRQQAATRLLPQQSPSSAARYLRKLRTGERTGRELAYREPIRKRIDILAPSRKLYRDVGKLGRRYIAQIIVDTDYGTKSANAYVDKPHMTVHEFTTHPNYPAWRATVEMLWAKLMNYPPKIIAVIDVLTRTPANVNKQPVILA